MAIVTISGDLGSGKSTATKLLIEKLAQCGLEYKRFSAGAAQRKVAEDLGFNDILEFNKYALKNPEIDFRMERKLQELGETQDNYVVDARLGWYLIPHSFKVKLTVSSKIGGERAFNDHSRKREGENFQSLEDAVRKVKARRKEEVSRFCHLYNVNIDDPRNFDIVIDTSNKRPEQILNIIFNSMRELGYLPELDKPNVKNLSPNDIRKLQSLQNTNDGR